MKLRRALITALLVSLAPLAATAAGGSSVTPAAGVTGSVQFRGSNGRLSYDPGFVYEALTDTLRVNKIIVTTVVFSVDGSSQTTSGGGGGSGDVTGVTAGYGLVGGGTSGDLTVSLNPNTTSFIRNGTSLQDAHFDIGYAQLVGDGPDAARGTLHLQNDYYYGGNYAATYRNTTDYLPDNGHGAISFNYEGATAPSGSTSATWISTFFQYGKYRVISPNGASIEWDMSSQADGTINHSVGDNWFYCFDGTGPDVQGTSECFGYRTTQPVTTGVDDHQFQWWADRITIYAPVEIASLKLTGLPGPGPLSADAQGNVSTTTASGGGGIASWPDALNIATSRLSLDSEPVSTSDRTGSKVYLSSGSTSLYISTWTVFTYNELSLSLTMTALKNYDVFLGTAAGVPALSLGVEWTNDSTRSEALGMQNGILVKGGDVTKRYLGTIRSTTTNTTEDSLQRRLVYNHYNRVGRALKKTDSTNSWNYTSSTIRPSNASTDNRVEAMIGVTGTMVRIQTMAHFDCTSAVTPLYSVDVDGTTANDAQTWGSMVGGGSFNRWGPAHGELATTPAAGFHFFQAVESVEAGGDCNIYGDDGGAREQTGITGQVGP